MVNRMSCILFTLITVCKEMSANLLVILNRLLASPLAKRLHVFFVKEWELSLALWLNLQWKKEHLSSQIKYVHPSALTNRSNQSVIFLENKLFSTFWMSLVNFSLYAGSKRDYGE